MIFIPYQNFYTVHAVVQDTAVRYRLYLTKSKLDVPNSTIVIPDILVAFGPVNNLSPQFIYWNNTYWYTPKGDMTETEKIDWLWSKRLVAIPHVALNGPPANAWNELNEIDPFGGHDASS